MDRQYVNTPQRNTNMRFIPQAATNVRQTYVPPPRPRELLVYRPEEPVVEAPVRQVRTLQFDEFATFTNNTGWNWWTEDRGSYTRHSSNSQPIKEKERYVIEENDKWSLATILNASKQQIKDSKYDKHVVIIPTNSQGVMGAGLAKVFRDRWPDIEMLQKKALAQNRHMLGYNYLQIGQFSNGVYFCTLPTKRRYYLPSYISDLDSQFSLLFKWLGDNSLVLMTKIGTGLGGLDWENVKTSLDRMTNNYYLRYSPTVFVCNKYFTPQDITNDIHIKFYGVEVEGYDCYWRAKHTTDNRYNLYSGRDCYNSVDSLSPLPTEEEVTEPTPVVEDVVLDMGVELDAAMTRPSDLRANIARRIRELQFDTANLLGDATLATTTLADALRMTEEPIPNPVVDEADLNNVFPF
jgi:hypothetical protein